MTSMAAACDSAASMSVTCRSTPFATRWDWSPRTVTCSTSRSVQFALARPAASDEELWDVLRRARLADLIASLPDGLDTVVGERGYRLSGGERQRLTIARLLLLLVARCHPRRGDGSLGLDVGGRVQAALTEALDGRAAVVAHCRRFAPPTRYS